MRHRVGVVLMALLSADVLAGAGHGAQATGFGLPIDAWGDSLTIGSGINPRDAWPSQLSFLLNGRTVRNFGVWGQTSALIAARAGGLIARVTIAGDQLPVAGTVDVEIVNDVALTSIAAEAVDGSIAGVSGTFAETPTGQDLFTRRTAGVPTKVAPGTPFVVRDYGRDIAVFWAGRNDVNLDDTDETVANVEAMVSRVTSRRFIVMSVLNGDGEGVGTAKYLEMREVNRRLAVRYPDNFVDVRGALVRHAGDSDADRVDRANDVVPASLRIDNQHLNAMGYRIVAEQVALFIQSRGW